LGLFAHHRLVTDVFANLLYTPDGTEVVGFDVGLCTIAPAVNNSGSFYQPCTIIHNFNNGTDQVVLVGALNFESDVAPLAVVGGVGAFQGASGSCVTVSNFPAFIYTCDFWTPNYRC
jgi:hypothetical protein